MDIKLKLREVLQANMGFAQCEDVKEVKTRWNIVKNRRLLQPHVDDYEEMRVKLVLEISPVNRNVEQEPAEKQREFHEKTKQLLEADCPINGLLKVEKKHLISANVTLQVLTAIFPFILDDEDKETTPAN